MLRGYKLWVTVLLAAAVLIGLSIDVPGCHSSVLIQPPYPVGVLPNPTLTPGMANPQITEDLVRSPGFRTKDYRDVSTDEKKQDADEYGVVWAAHKNYEFDHFIPLDIGGSNDIRNLWPEPLHLNVQGYDLGSKTKDKLEAALGEMVKSGRLSLTEAQEEVLDWPAAYQRYLGAFPAYTKN